MASNEREVIGTIQVEHRETRGIVTRGLNDLQQRYIDDREHQAILDSLFFDSFHSRHEDISETHRNTFQWIFDTTTAKPWPSFAAWLEKGSGVYWIKGKAGSGKSTLMKFICNDDRTEASLRYWSDEQALLMPSYFFWNAGSKEQKSTTGMLRSVLYQIIDAIPALSACLLGSRRGGRMYLNSAWTISRLVDALISVSSQKEIPIRICYVLDGLDEAEDHGSLLDFIERLSNMQNVKFIASSRPLRKFELTFRDAAILQLHDLTQRDISIFTSDRLAGHEGMRRHSLAEPAKAQELVSQVVNKSDGVFLWVVLATQQLVTGLENEDSIDQLLERLRLLPAELGELYAVMLDSFDRIYYQEALQYFNLMLTFRGANMHLLDFAFAEGDPVEVPLFGKTGGYSAPEFFSRIESLKVKILTRCKGLLEVQDTRNTAHTGINHFAARYIGPTLDVKLRRYFDRHITVRWLHRTVPDFLLSTAKGRAFMTQGSDYTVKAYQSHMRSHLGRLRMTQPFLEVSTNSRDNRYVENIMHYAAKLERTSNSANVRIMDNIDSTISRIQASLNIAPTPHWCARFAPAEDFLGFAASKGLFLYVQEKISKDEGCFTADAATYLLRCVNLRYWDFRDQALYCETLTTLLQRGADPNASHGVSGRGLEATPWKSFLVVLWKIHKKKRSPRGAWIVAATTFTNMGAEMDLMLSLSEKDRYRVGSYAIDLHLSPSSILQHFLGRGVGYENLEDAARQHGGHYGSKVGKIYVKGSTKDEVAYVVQTQEQSDMLVAAWQAKERAISESNTRESKKAVGASAALIQIMEHVLEQLKVSESSPSDL